VALNRRMDRAVQRVTRLGAIEHQCGDAPADVRLNPTESSFVSRLNESFATQSIR
jgi:hypothetical protein